jgi:membrane-bound lytic murein transglycosylase B
MRFGFQLCPSGRRRRDKKGTVRIVSHLPDIVASETRGRHRVVANSGGKSAGKHASAPRKPAGAHTRAARHQRRVQHAGGTRPLVTAIGVLLAAAPWALVLFAPMSEGASSPSLAAQASASPSPPDYPPLLVVPLDSSATNNGAGGSNTSGLPVVSSAGPASPPPQWLVNSQLRQPASAVGTAPMVSPAVLDSLKATGIPRRVLAAYIYAAATEDRLSPTCGLSWQVLAGIGFIESGHAHSGGSKNPNWSGIADPPIYGPLLDGQNGIALITDSDQGALDGNATYDRAVGPMQFLPSTWREYEVGASGHSAPNPQNIDDATLSAARYLCATGPDLRTPDGLIAAVYSYNHSFDYVTAVLSVAIRYAGGNLPGGSSALAELPALAQTAVDLPTAPATPPTVLSPTPSSLPYPSPSPAPPASLPPYYQSSPAPTYAPQPTVAPSAPTFPLPSSPASPPPASASPDPSPTANPSPTASPSPSPSASPSPSPADSAPPSSAPESSAPASASPTAPSSSSPTPSPTEETP